MKLCALFLFLVSSLGARADILIIGEAAHGYEPVIEQEIAFLQRGERSCLFLEVSPSATAGMQAYVSGNSDYDHAVGAWIDAVTKASNEPFTNIISASLLDAARDAGLKVFGVDGEVLDAAWRSQNDTAVALMRTAGTNKKIWQKIADIAITGRNQTMAANIAQDIKNNSCENSFFIVGTSHTKNSYQDISVKPIQDVLLSIGLASSLEMTSLCGTNCGSSLLH